VVWDAGNDMSVVQAAHLAGAFWGAVLGLALGRRQRSPPAPVDSAVVSVR